MTSTSTSTPASTHNRLRSDAMGRAQIVEDATGLLTRSFHDQPHFRDMFPDAGARTRALPRLFGGLLGDAGEHGRVHTVGSHGALAGVAVWYPPGAYPLRGGRKLRATPAMVRMAAAAPRSLRRVLQFQAASSRLHPEQPHWYLAVIGVDPAFQGCGLGTGLLRAGLEEVDASRQPSYLETHTIRSVDWYRAHGFGVRAAEVCFTPGGPPNWTMYRPGALR